MRVLFRVALALLIGIPVCLALLIFFVLEARGGASPPVDRRNAGSSERTPHGPQRAAA
jgi:hypothetical protein